MAKILVTGFQPFLGETINPSEILLECIKKDFSFSTSVKTLLLPVSFQRAFEVLEKEILVNEYQIILLLGQAGGRDKVCLERVGLNWIETEKPDEDGVTPVQGPIDKNPAQAVFSTLPLTAWKEELTALDVPAMVSLSAGGYVCNYVYYKTLRLIEDKGLKSQVCFIHVPYLPEQTVNKPQGTDSLELDVMFKAIKVVLAKCL